MQALNPVRALTDIVYQNLFGKTTLSLLLHLKLSPLEVMDEQDTALRDSLGTLALQALNAIETACTKDMKQYRKGNIAWDMLCELVQYHANEIANEYKAEAAKLGIDLLSGQPLTTTTN